MAHDWQSADVIDLLTGQLMTDILEWRQERGRAARDTQDYADLRRAIAFAGEKLDGFQMARFLEDSRLWPADQQLVLKLQYATKERDQIIKKLNTPPAPPRIEGAVEVAIGAVFKENGEEYTVTAGPDHRGDWEVTQTSSGRVYKNIGRDTIQRYLDLALRSQPNVPAPVAAKWPILSAPYVGLIYSLGVGRDDIEVVAGPTHQGRWTVKNLSSGHTFPDIAPASILRHYHDNGPGAGHMVNPGGQTGGGTGMPNVVVNVGLRFKDYLGNRWKVISRRPSGRWTTERADTGVQDAHTEQDIQERFRDCGAW